MLIKINLATATKILQVFNYKQKHLIMLPNNNTKEMATTVKLPLIQK